MIAQRMMHSEAVEIVDENGEAVRHTPEFITRMFDEELERLLSEGSKEDQAATARLREARRMSEEMIHREEFNSA
jgi:hypothetical protein